MEFEGKKRRSFVDVRRKSLLFDKMFNENNEEFIPRTNPTLTLKNYLMSLTKEKLQWKDVLQLRRKQLELLKSSCTMEICASEVEPFLDEEDKTFLDDEPDYLNMMESVEKYLKAADFLKRYKSDLVEYYHDLVEEIESETNVIVEHLCQSGRCDLCNRVGCSDSDHKFPAI